MENFWEAEKQFSFLRWCATNRDIDGSSQIRNGISIFGFEAIDVRVRAPMCTHEHMYLYLLSPSLSDIYSVLWPQPYIYIYIYRNDGRRAYDRLNSNWSVVAASGPRGNHVAAISRRVYKFCVGWVWLKVR